MEYFIMMHLCEIVINGKINGVANKRRNKDNFCICLDGSLKSKRKRENKSCAPTNVQFKNSQ